MLVAPFMHVWEKDKIESKLARFIVKPIFYHFLANVGKKSLLYIYEHIRLAIDRYWFEIKNCGFFPLQH